MSALLAAVLAQTAASPTGPAPAGICQGLCDAGRLDDFLAKLERARAAGRPVRIFQIGDSHTAGDQITGAWRSALQRRFGSAGRGPMIPGRPYQGYVSRGVTVLQSSGWSPFGIFGTNFRSGDPRRSGVSGFGLTSTLDGASLQLRADGTDAWFDSVSICGFSSQDGASASVTTGYATTRVALARGPDRDEICRTVQVPVGTSVVTVAVPRGVTLTSWSTDRQGGGVELSNFGTVGSQFVHWSERTDDTIVADEIQYYRPDLIVVAFGTNEAFAPNLSAGVYETQLRAGLNRLRRLAPGVPILLLAAPDSGTRSTSLRYPNGGAPAYAPCVGVDAGGGDTVDPALAASAVETRSTSTQGRSAIETAAWGPTAGLAPIQSVQRSVARAVGTAFWDWSARMGGRCSSAAWATASPPLMRGDHVHFTTPGANEIVRRLEGDLENAVARSGRQADEGR